jgi:hypothetical protein
MNAVSGREIARLVALFDDTLDAKQAERLRGRVQRQPQLSRAHRQIARAREAMATLAEQPAPDLPYEQIEAQIRWHLAHDPAPGLLRRLWRRRPKRALATVAVTIAALTLAASVGTALYHRVVRDWVRTDAMQATTVPLGTSAETGLLIIDNVPRGAEVRLDSVVIGRARMLLRSPVGRHVVEIWQQDRLLERRSIDVRADGTTRVVLER